MLYPADLANKIVIALNGLKIPFACILGLVAIGRLAWGAFVGEQDKRVLISTFISFMVTIAIWLNIEDFVKWIAHL
jgi:hypothetical protein